MTLGCLKLLGQVLPAYDPVMQRERTMLLVLLAVIGMVCLLAAAVRTRRLKMVIAVGAGILGVLLAVSVLANVGMLFVRPQPVAYLRGGEIVQNQDLYTVEQNQARAEAGGQRGQQPQGVWPSPEVYERTWEVNDLRQKWYTTRDKAGEAPAEAPDAGTLPLRQQLFSDLVDTWQADVYPSEKAAVRALLARIDQQIDSVTADQKGPVEIQVQGKVRHELLVQVVDALKKTHSESRITFAQTPDESVMPPTDKQTVVVHVLSAQGAKGITPYVRMQAVGWEHSRTEQANFVNKPWVDDFAAFLNQNHTQEYIVAVSQNPAISAEESKRNAIAVAVGSLKPRIQGLVDAGLRGMSGTAYGTQDPWLQERIAEELENGYMVSDRFVQRLQAPYGEVWQTSLLVDASRKSIANLARKCEARMLMQQSRGRHTVLSVIGVIALVCLVYAGLNALTRGYFVWSLRAMTLAIIAGGIFLVLVFWR